MRVESRCQDVLECSRLDSANTRTSFITGECTAEIPGCDLVRLVRATRAFLHPVFLLRSYHDPPSFISTRTLLVRSCEQRQVAHTPYYGKTWMDTQST